MKQVRIHAVLKKEMQPVASSPTGDDVREVFWLKGPGAQESMMRAPRGEPHTIAAVPPGGDAAGTALSDTQFLSPVSTHIFFLKDVSLTLS